MYLREKNRNILVFICIQFDKTCHTIYIYQNNYSLRSNFFYHWLAQYILMSV
jgi:hypothetical protein